MKSAINKSYCNVNFSKGRGSNKVEYSIPIKTKYNLRYGVQATYLCRRGLFRSASTAVRNCWVLFLSERERETDRQAFRCHSVTVPESCRTYCSFSEEQLDSEDIWRIVSTPVTRWMAVIALTDWRQLCVCGIMSAMVNVENISILVFSHRTSQNRVILSFVYIMCSRNNNNNNALYVNTNQWHEDL